MKMVNMRVIGLTGGIASGKTTVSSILKDLGAVVIDADEVARRMVEPGQPAWQDILATFGPGVLNDDRTLNRPALAARVFGNPELLQKLNRITHPRVREYIEQKLAYLREQRPDAVVVLDVPLLYESGMDKMADEVWVVWVDEEVELARLMERDGLAREDALKRLRAQMPLREKARRADRVIDNTGTRQETARQTTRFFNESIGQA